MRPFSRIGAVLLAAWLCCAFVVGVQGHAFALSCANPTRLSMVNGAYKTSSQVQYDASHFTQMDAWSPDPTLQQSMSICSWSNWSVTVTEPDTSNPRVETYPDSDFRFTTWADCTHSPDWSTLPRLTSTYAMSAPKAGDYDESYDVFFGGTIGGHNCGAHREVMVYTTWHGNVFAPAPLAHFTTRDGQSYDVWWNTAPSVRAFNFRGELRGAVVGDYVQVRRATQAAAGTVNLKQVFRALNKLGALGPHELTDFVDFGVEVVSGTNTARQPLTFKLTQFSVRT